MYLTRKNDYVSQLSVGICDHCGAANKRVTVHNVDKGKKLCDSCLKCSLARVKRERTSDKDTDVN